MFRLSSPWLCLCALTGVLVSGLLVSGLVVPITSEAQLSKQDILELAAAGEPTARIVARVQAECIDFQADALTIADLSGALPREVLEAIATCRETKQSSLHCRLYRAASGDNELQGFPFVVRQIRHGEVTLDVMERKAWVDERTSGPFDIRGIAREIQNWDAHEALLRERLESVSGLRDLDIEFETRLDTEELTARQLHAVLDVCAEDSGEPAGVPLLVNSTPDGAAVVVDGVPFGQTPLQASVPEKEVEIEVLLPGYGAYRTVAEGVLDQQLRLDVELQASEQSCLSFGLSGDVDGQLRALEGKLEGQRIQLVVPLVEVVSSKTALRVPCTHVVEGRRILFEPSSGDEYVDHPDLLLGQDLGGWAFGETARRLVILPPGPVTVIEVDDGRHGLQIELLHESGEKTKVYFDFVRDLDEVPVSELEAGMCRIFAAL